MLVEEEGSRNITVHIDKIQIDENLVKVYNGGQGDQGPML
jgi:hypothetical protein